MITKNARKNYRELREKHYPYLISSHYALRDAEVRARKRQADIERQLVLANAKIRFLGAIGLIGAIASIVAVPLSIYLWMLAHDDFCALHGRKAVLSWMCPAKSRPLPAAGGG